jgi:hypothetical protein
MQKLSLYSQNFVEWTLADRIPASDVEWARRLSRVLFGVSLDDLMEQRATSRQASEKLHYIVRQIVRKNNGEFFTDYVAEKVILSMAN